MWLLSSNPPPKKKLKACLNAWLCSVGRKAGLPEEKVKSFKPVDEENAERVFVEVEQANGDAVVVFTGVIWESEPVCSNI